MKETEYKYKVSVIIPCYNQGKYLDEAVDSVLKQTYQNFEIIIINDGSTDKFTNDLLKDYKKPKTKIFRTMNKGLANTRNYGFALSKGDFIQFLDADDFLDKEKFKEQIEIFKADKSIDICYTNYQLFIQENKTYIKPTINVGIGSDPLNAFLYKWSRGLTIPIHCAIFRKHIWHNSLPFITDFKACEDWLMWINLAKKGYKFKHVHKDMAFYRIQERNMTRDREFMFYWATRAASYIVEHLIDSSERKRFETKTQNYFKKLVNIFWIDTLNQELRMCEEKLKKSENNLIIKENKLKKSENNLIIKENKLERITNDSDRIINSRSYRLGRVLTWGPKRIRGLFTNSTST